MWMKGIYFDSILDASGVQGFFGGRGRKEEYRYRRYMGPFQPNFAGLTFVSKTSTLLQNIGNAPMESDGITLKELFPKCILPNFRPGNIILSLRMFIEGFMLNAVGLSGPGFEALLEMDRWQKITEPFLISIMSIAKTPEDRLAETREFVRLLLKHLPNFGTRFGVQKNYSCPNIGMNIDDLIDEVMADLDILAELGMPIMPNSTF